MTRTIGFGLLIVAILIAWQSYAISSLLQTCTAKARAIIAAADPLDRAPPPSVAKSLARNIPFDELVDTLTRALLDHYACHRNPNWNMTDWLIERPALASALPKRLSASELVALFASTAQTSKGDIGLASAARRFYNKSLSSLEDADVDCLIQRTKGTHISPAEPGMPYWTHSYKCQEPQDFFVRPVP